MSKDDTTVQKLNPQELLPPVVQPRLPAADVEGMDALEALSTSLTQTGGNVQPIVVAWDTTEEAWRIIHGERRWRAALMAQLPAVDCVIRPSYPSMTNFIRSTIAENGLREELSEIELAWSLYVSYYIANLKAMGEKYDQSLDYLTDIEAEAEKIAASIHMLDEHQCQYERQQAVKSFLEQALADALDTIGMTLSQWKANPLVPWEVVTQEMGLGYLKARDRSRYLRLLQLSPEIAGDVNTLSLSTKEALANLPEAEQVQIVDDAKANGRLDKLTAKDVQQYRDDDDGEGGPKTFKPKHEDDFSDDDTIPHPTAGPLPFKTESELDEDDPEEPVTRQALRLLETIEFLAVQNEGAWTPDDNESLLERMVMVAVETGAISSTRFDPAYTNVLAIMLPALAEFVSAHAEQINAKWESGHEPQEILHLFLNQAMV